LTGAFLFVLQNLHEEKKMKHTVANRIEEAGFVTINGQCQWITLRGDNRHNPVLLIVGGPGAAISTWATFFQPWEENFTLVQWDQPGAGATYGLHGEAGLEPYSLGRICNDVVAVADHIRRHLGVDRIIYFGLSGGTVIGLMAMLQKPQSFRAYIGSGQFVHWQRQARLSYDLVMDRARSEGDMEGVRELEQIGPPLYTGIEAEVIKSKYAGRPTPAELIAMGSIEADVLAAMRSPPASANYIAPGINYCDPIPLATRMFDRLRPELYAFDAWQLGTSFELPMIFIQGDQDYYSVTSEVERYYADLSAPYKQLYILNGAGHCSFYLRDRLLAAMIAELQVVA